MGERGFKVSAVVLGLAADLVATTLGALLLIACMTPSLLRSGVPFDAFERHLVASVPFLVAVVLVGAAATALGGYVAGRMARHAPYRHALALGVVWLGIGALPGEESDVTWPWAFDAASCLVVIPAALLGAHRVSRAPKAGSEGAVSPEPAGGVP